MKELNAQQYDHYGCLKMNQREAVSLIDYLIASRFLEIEGTKYPLVHVTNRGWDVLDGKIIVKRRIAKVQQQKRIFNENEDPDLFEALRRKRMELAKEQHVPAFMIFSDRSLHDMAKIKPKNSEEFLEVNGVGQAKMKKYGSRMIEVIKNF